MQGAIHFVAPRLAAILSILGLGLCTGCQTRVDVSFDDREDFARYRTWDFVPRILPRVDAPYGDPRALDGRLAQLIEQALRERGFERRSDHPDFLVSYHLGLRRRPVTVIEPSAPYLLSSHNASASYFIEGGSRAVLQIHEDVHLAIRFADPTDLRRTWRALLMRTLVNSPELPLEDAVTTLLDRFPPAGFEAVAVDADGRAVRERDRARNAVPDEG